MDDVFALRTGVVVLQVLDDARLAEGVKTLRHGRRVHQVAATDLAGDHLVQLTKLAPAIQRVSHFEKMCFTKTLFYSFMETLLQLQLQFGIFIFLKLIQNGFMKLSITKTQFHT